jgi:hypothetical protein
LLGSGVPCTHQLSLLVSTVQPIDITLSKVPMKNAFVLTHDWLKHSEGISKQSYEDMKGLCVYE